MSDAPVAAVAVERPGRGCVTVGALSVGRWLVHAFIAALLLGHAASLLHLADFYMHEDLKIPAVTVLAWNSSRWMSHHGLIVLPVLLIIDAMVLVGLECLPSAARWLARVWFSFICVAVIVMMAFSTFVMVFPIKVWTDSRPAKQAPAEVDLP